MAHSLAVDGAECGVSRLSQSRRMARAAIWYARREIRVHPLRPGTKRPILQEWQKRATTDPATILGWWSHWPGAGIGLATGVESGIVAIDLDPRHGSDDSILDLERDHGELPATWRCATAGGGTHIYFAHPGGRIANRVGVWPGVDVRGDGGYVVAAPTTLEDDRYYVWESESGPHEVELARAPDWLLSRLAKSDGRDTPRAAESWVAVVRDGAELGARNDTVARLAGYLLRRQPSPRVVLELIRAWSDARCRPPLADDELTATVDSIARMELARRTSGRRS